jgi:hypothetical protein
LMRLCYGQIRPSRQTNAPPRHRMQKPGRPVVWDAQPRRRKQNSKPNRWSLERSSSSPKMRQGSRTSSYWHYSGTR